MNFVNKIFFLLILSLVNLFPQEYFSEQLRIADSLFASENYFDAITEYKRLLFFDLTNQFTFHSNYQIGLAYKAGAKYPEAIKYFFEAEINAKSSEQVFLCREEQIRVNILRRSTSRAENLINNMMGNSAYINYSKRLKYWLGWTFIFSDKWREAADLFSSIDETELAEICRITDNKLYSVDFAKYSSVIIPGLGQFYTGEYLNGLISLGWNLLSGYLTIKSFADDRIFDGIVTANLLWLRFYRGNFTNAEKFALEKNLSLSNQTLEYLQNNFGGLKP